MELQGVAGIGTEDIYLENKSEYNLPIDRSNYIKENDFTGQ